MKEASGVVELRVVCKKLDMYRVTLDLKISHLAGLIYDKDNHDTSWNSRFTARK